MPNHAQLSIIGSGSWGSALAIAASRRGVRTLLWGPEPEQLRTLEAARCNEQYLGPIEFPPDLVICHEFEAAMAADVILLAVPSHVFKSVVQRVKPYCHSQALCWATKGLDPDTNRFPSDLVAEVFGDSWPMAVLSGPSFAKEVAQGFPTAVVAAANQTALAQQLQSIFQQPTLRVDLSEDLIGVQLGGAAKNVIAIATGIVDGVAPSANTRAAVITRGLHEITRLGLALGARQETFYGFSGLGDLVLTCSDDQSRNRRFGLAIGQGHSQQQALDAIGQVVEGLKNVDQVLELAQTQRVDMPVTQVVHRLLEGEIEVDEGRLQLLNA